MQKESEYSVAKGPYKSYPGDWKVVELGNLLSKIGRPVEVIPDREYREIGIRSHGKGLFYKEPVKGSDLGNKSVFWVEANCLIINIVFAWEQAVAITTLREEGMIASHRFPMWRSKGNADLNYLWYVFLTPFGRRLLELASPGGAGRNRTLGRDDFNKTSVCIPSNIEEQQRIVKILSTWDKAIELKEKLIGEKKRQKKWLMQNLLSGKKRLPGFTDEWKEVRLGDLFRFEGGLSFSRNELQTDKGICYLHYGDIHKSTKNYINVEEEYSQLPKLLTAISDLNTDCLLNNGDIVFVDTSEDYEGMGKYIVVKKKNNIPFIAGLHTIIARPVSESIADDFKRYCFSTFDVKKQFTVLANGTSVYGINKNSIKKISFLLPPLPEQTAIAEVLSTADQEIDLHEKQLEELKKQKKTLMQLLLTGIIRVNTQEVSS
ncbi:restriction endonuclease subunit S [Pelotomaculum terephthalicicum JT]|uniref:restriction endonuclease subunit S n=1 Tax=Pelotomaculum terephthalicicum TaxID=206393 RepID=UPI001F04C2D3|nr:restriction endonuclease subunit S [Pelotomaculum terephthalicicum]MCG9968248.1 restriction endonuclease subunit S [Pelotomaculum terephthalicicum JT]